MKKKSNKQYGKKISMGVFIATAVFMAIAFLVFCMISTMPGDGDCTGGIIFSLICIALFVLGALRIRCSIKKTAQSIRDKYKQADEAKYKENTNKLYEMCRKNGILNAGKANTGDFMLIAKQFGITDYSEALKRFEEGKKAAAATDEADKEKEKQKCIESANKYLDEATKHSEMVGKEKYLSPMKQLCKWYGLGADILESNSRIAHDNAIQVRRERSRDWASAGGFASAIAGPAAGAAVAADLQAKNARDDATRADRIQKHNEDSRKYKKQANDAQGMARILENDINRIEASVADEDIKYFDNISFKANRVSVNMAGIMSIDVSASVEPVSVLGQPAIVDGSVFMYVCKNGRRIGRTIVCAPSFPKLERSMVDDMGFDKLTGSTVYCKPYPGELFSNANTYTFEYEPCHI